MSKYKLIGIFVLIFYLITPIFSGIMGYWDYRGPKIYWQPYHEFFTVLDVLLRDVLNLF